MALEQESNTIHLISPPAKWMHSGIPYPPLGLAYLSAIGKQNGIGVNVIDGQFSEFPEKMANLFNKKGPQLVGISATLMQLPDSIAIAKKIKASNPWSIVVFGGAGPNCLSPEQFYSYTSNSVDLVCQGEGELTWTNILQRFLGSDNRSKELLKPQYVFDDIQGTVLFTKDQIKINPPRAQIQDLDTLPFPDLEAIEASRYIELWKKNGGMGSISIFPSRGCPYACVFCDKTIFGRKFRHNSPTRIVNEMERIASDYDLVEDIFLFDDNLSTQRGVMLGLCQEIQSKDLKVSWSCQARVNTVDPELLKTMYDSGCKEIYFGIEAATEKLLTYLGKNISIDQAAQAMTWAREVGMKPGCFFMVGVPTETKEDIEAIATFVRRVKPSYIGLSVLIPFPGTELYTRTHSLIKPELLERFDQWDDTRSSIYKDNTFAINPKESVKYIEKVFRDMIGERGIDYNPSQFVIHRYDE